MYREGKEKFGEKTTNYKEEKEKFGETTKNYNREVLEHKNQRH